MSIPGSVAREGWIPCRLKDIAQLNRKTLAEDTPPDREFRYVDISGVDELGRITGWEDTDFGNAPSRARRLASPGDIVLSTVRTYLRAIAKVPENSADLVFSTGFAVLHANPQMVHPEFLWRALQSEANVQWIVAHSEGIGYPSISPSELGQLRIVVPSLPRQRAIASFLDRETARIDTLIAKKERLLVLLDEKRTALITKAVTKGLDPAVRMKGSGVEWLGEVPAHWEVKRLKFLLKEPLMYGANEVAELSDPGCPRFIRITDVRDDGTLRDETFKSLPEGVAQPFLLRTGDLLFARSGATVGKTFRYNESWGRAAFAGYLIRARVDERALSSRFLECFTQSGSYWDWLSSTFIQATIQNVSAERYANLLVPVPPQPEQDRLVAFLDSARSEIGALSGQVRNAISLLREYRTALISAAVTGQIDVSGGG